MIRIYVHHNMFDLWKLCFYGVMGSLGNSVSFVQGESTIGAYFYVYVNLIAKYSGIQKVYTENTLLPGSALFQLFNRIFIT